MTITGSTVSGNSSEGFEVSGGGLDNYGTATITNCTFSDNYDPRKGGGIHNSGKVTISGTTISGNSANNSPGAHGPGGRHHQIGAGDDVSSGFPGRAADRGGRSGPRGHHRGRQPGPAAVGRG